MPSCKGSTWPAWLNGQGATHGNAASLFSGWVVRSCSARKDSILGCDVSIHSMPLGVQTNTRCVLDWAALMMLGCKTAHSTVNSSAIVVVRSVARENIMPKEGGVLQKDSWRQALAAAIDPVMDMGQCPPHRCHSGWPSRLMPQRFSKAATIYYACAIAVDLNGLGKPTGNC